VIRSIGPFEEVLPLVDGVSLEEPLDFGETALLVIVGRYRTNDCRRTVMREVGTRLRKARVTLEEHEPGPGCRCREQQPVRSVFGVLVAPFISKGVVEEVAVQVDCGAAGASSAATLDASEPILTGTLVEGEPGTRFITDGETWRAFCAEMHQADSCLAVDFTRFRVAVAVGQPLQDSCRRTVQEGVTVEGRLARIRLREIYPRADQICVTVFGGFQVFAFLVPAAVEEVALESRRVS
jgi:hypothetical protein